MCPKKLPERFPHQAALIQTLSTSNIRSLTDLLYVPPSITPVPTAPWLAAQATLITHLPIKLRRPAYRRRDGTSRHDGQTNLCTGHEGLNGYVMSALLALLCAECEYYNSDILHFPEGRILAEILRNQQTGHVSELVEGEGELYVGNRCAGCILSAVGSSKAAVETLYTAIRVAVDRGARDYSVLERLLLAWAERLGLDGLGEKGDLYWGIWRAWEDVDAGSSDMYDIEDLSVHSLVFGYDDACTVSCCSTPLDDEYERFTNFPHIQPPKSPDETHGDISAQSWFDSDSDEEDDCEEPSYLTTGEAERQVPPIPLQTLEVKVQKPSVVIPPRTTSIRETIQKAEKAVQMGRSKSEATPNLSRQGSSLRPVKTEPRVIYDEARQTPLFESNLRALDRLDTSPRTEGLSLRTRLRRSTTRSRPMAEYSDNRVDCDSVAAREKSIAFARNIVGLVELRSATPIEVIVDEAARFLGKGSAKAEGLAWYMSKPSRIFD